MGVYRWVGSGPSFWGASSQVEKQSCTPTRGRVPRKRTETLMDLSPILLIFLSPYPQTTVLLQQEFSVLSVCTSPGQREKACRLEWEFQAPPDQRTHNFPPITSLQSLAWFGSSTDVMGIWADFQGSLPIGVGEERGEKSWDQGWQ